MKIKLSDVDGLLSLKKWMVVFEYIGKGYCTVDISYTTRITYSHIVKITSEFKKCGWITSTIVGRKKDYTLTEEGRVVFELVEKINNLFIEK